MARNEVWAIDIGEAALKAVKARRVGSRLEALAFDVVPYEQILSAPGVDADAQVRQALATFVGRNVVKRQRVVATISARSALIRFVKLPPVDPKKIADVVQYEASQHIPFPLEEVVWDYQAMRGGQVINFEVEVGMFAMRKEIVRNFLTNLLATGLEVDKLQLTPIALCNFVYYDRSPKEALVVLDVGAANSRLLVVEGESVWIRSLGIGGNDFTRAIASKFKIPFPKAEVLKRRGSTSAKYARQVFDALRTPAKNLVDEVQRSLGYYKSTHKEAKMGQILLLGRSFALTELARFVEVSLGLKAEVFREPKNISVGAVAGLAKYREYAASYGVALGLAVEGLGLGLIETNMLPKEIVRKKALGRKQPFAAAAAALILLSVLIAYGLSKSRLSSLTQSHQRAPQLVEELNKLERGIKTTKKDSQSMVNKIGTLYKAGGARRDMWLDILDAITDTLRSEDPQSAILLVRLASEVTGAELKAVEKVVTKRDEIEQRADERARRIREGWSTMTDEERRAIFDEAEDEEEELEALERTPPDRLKAGRVGKREWEEGLNPAQQRNYVTLLKLNEALGAIKVNWGEDPGKSWPSFVWVRGYAPSAAPGGGAGPGGGGGLAYVGVKKILRLTLNAERRLTQEPSTAVDEIEEQFVQPLRKYPFFVEVKAVNHMRVIYVEDMEGYRLGKKGSYKPAPGLKTRDMEWITFDVIIKADSTVGLSAATASTAAVG